MASIQELFKEKASERYLMLNEMSQKFPERLKITGHLIAKSQAGKEYVLLDGTDDEGDHFKISVFGRDVKQCVSQWGADPKSWGFVSFTPSFSGNRMQLRPAEDQFELEEDA